MSALAAELTAIELGDQRRNQRAQRVVEKLGDKPTVSIPAACGGWDETQAAYRLFDHPEVTAERVLAPHIACTEERLRAHPRVLCVQDTTKLDYTTQKDIAGLGPLNDETRRGMYLHPTLALTPERVPLGLLDLYRWARKPGSLGQGKNPSRTLEEKEMRPVLDAAPVLTEVTFDRPASNGRFARAVHQHIQAVRVTLKAPSRPDRILPDVTVTALLATEIDPPAGEDPLD
jgi:hypothetical protein